MRRTIRILVRLLWIGFMLEQAGALDSPRPALVVDGTDAPVAAWVEREGPRTVGRIARWSGTQWISLGGVLNRHPDQAVASVALGVGPRGQLWAAWGERPLELAGKDRGSGLLHVATWSGTTWLEPAVSPSLSTNTIADRPQIEVDAQGRPWVLWSEMTPDFNVENVYLARLDGDAWTIIDRGSLTTDISSASRSRDLALDRSSRPVLAYSLLVYRHDFQVFASPWDGSRWNPWGTPLNLNPDAWAGFPSLALDSEDRPWVAFLQSGEGFQCVVRKWTGTDWVAVGPPGVPGSRSPKLLMGRGGAVFLGTIELDSGLVVRQWKGARWEGLPLTKAGVFVDTYDLATDSRGTLWALWAEDDASGQRLGIARQSPAGWEIFPGPPLATKAVARILNPSWMTLKP